MTWDAEPGYAELTIEDTMFPVPNPGPQCQPTDDEKVSAETAHPGIDYRTNIDPEIHLYPHGDAAMSALRSGLQQTYETARNEVDPAGTTVEQPVELPDGGVREVVHSRAEPSNNYLVVATTVTDPASGTVYDVLVKDALVSK